MANWLSNGGCFNAMRWANDGAGQGSRDWAAAIDIDIPEQPISDPLILATSWDSDDMNTISGDFEVQFRNLTDAGSFAIMTGATEIAWSSSTDLINGNAVIAAEELGQTNCSGKGPSRIDGVERSGANAIAQSSIASKDSFDLQWAIDFSGATVDKEYEFRIVETGTSNVYATLAGTVITVTVGDLTGITKDNDGVALGSCFVALFKKTEGGGPPHDYVFVSSQTSNASTGAYTFSNQPIAREYFVYSIKEDTPHVFDATDDVLTPV